MNLRTESSKSKEEKEEDKEKNSNNNKSLFNSLNHNSNLNFQRNEKKRLSKNISISSSNKSPHGADENVFIHKLVNEENTIKKTHEKNSKIIRAKKNKVEKIITKDSKATDAEAEEIEKKMNKINDFNSINNIDEKMNEDLKRKNELYIFNINQDIAYQLSKGTLSMEEKKRYEDLKENINTMKIDMNSFVKDFESTFVNLKGDIENIEELRRNEERINSFYFYLNEARNKSNMIRSNLTKNRIKVIDYRSINKLLPLLHEDSSNKLQKKGN